MTIEAGFLKNEIGLTTIDLLTETACGWIHEFLCWIQEIGRWIHEVGGWILEFAIWIHETDVGLRIKTS